MPRPLFWTGQAFRRPVKLVINDGYCLAYVNAYNYSIYWQNTTKVGQIIHNASFYRLEVPFEQNFEKSVSTGRFTWPGNNEWAVKLSRIYKIIYIACHSIFSLLQYLKISTDIIFEILWLRIYSEKRYLGLFSTIIHYETNKPEVAYHEWKFDSKSVLSFINYSITLKIFTDMEN